MSISATSSSGSNWGMGAVQQRRKPPELTKEQLDQLQEKLKSEGKDTANLDKIVENFSKLDASGDGKLSMDELKTGADQYGINLPKGGPKDGPKGPPPGENGNAQGPRGWGPPPGLLSDSNASGSETDATEKADANSFLLKLLEKFAGSDPVAAQDAESTSSSVNVAA